MAALRMLVESAHFALYPHGMMQTVCRALFAGFLGLSVLFTAMPTPAAGATPAKSSCCARMKAVGSQNDCGKDAPKLPQDRQCCVGCANCLALYLPNHHSLNFSPSLAWTLALTSMHGNGRSERPPVPPPRAAIV